MFITIAIIVFTLLLFATACDLRTREIPDWISIVLLGMGLIVAWFGWTGLSLTAALIGAVLGFAISFPLFHLGGIGGGDVKLVTALGSILGPAGLLLAMFWIAITGGVLAVIAKLRGQNDFAYVPAILAGVTISLVRQGGLL